MAISKEEIVRLYCLGMKMREVAAKLHCSAQYVSLVVLQHGVKRPNKPKPDDPWLKTLGISREEKEHLSSIGALKAFRVQRDNAKKRGIGWNITLAEWWKLWTDSGKWEQRGCLKGQFVMSRHGDAGNYEAGNVSIKTNSENSKEALRRWSTRKKKNRGVFYLYPGLAKPWVVQRHGAKFFFATEEEAIKARKNIKSLVATTPDQRKDNLFKANKEWRSTRY